MSGNRIRQLLGSRLAVTLFGMTFTATVVTASAARSIFIDTFDTDQTSIVFTPDASASNQASGTGILGGERDVTVTRTSGVGVTAVASGGVYSYGHVAGSLGTVSLSWDGVDGSSVLDPTGLGGVDLTDGNISDAFSMSVLFNDFSAPLTLTVYTDAANASQATVWLPGDIPPDPQMMLTVPFVDFAAIAGAGADFAAVGAVVLDIDGSATAGLDVEIDSLSTIALPVPEPSSALLLAGGIAGFAWIRRRRCRI